MALKQDGNKIRSWIYCLYWIYCLLGLDRDSNDVFQIIFDLTGSLIIHMHVRIQRMLGYNGKKIEIKFL